MAIKAVFIITSKEVQEIALQKLGRKLTTEEMRDVRKGIEWGFVDWEQTVKFAINNLFD